MKVVMVFLLILICQPVIHAQSGQKGSEYATKNFVLKGGKVSYNADLDLLIFEFTVEGVAGKTVPRASGSMDKAPVLAYVFPTTLKSDDVGFSETVGIVALAVTTHPDFDDSPVFDENNDGIYNNDGLTFHTHWVVLVQDERIPAKLAVKEFTHGDKNFTPPTSPGMHMFMDSPGYSVVLKGNIGRVLVPSQRVNFKTQFNYDVVTSYLEVNTSDKSRPMLGVYQVYSVLSGNLSLPYTVK